MAVTGGGGHNPHLHIMCDAILVGDGVCQILNFRCPLFFISWRRHCSVIEILKTVVGDDIRTGVVLFVFLEALSCCTDLTIYSGTCLYCKSV